MIVFSNRENCIHPHLYLTQFQFSFLDGISRWRVGTGLGMDHRGRHRGHDRGDEGDGGLPGEPGVPVRAEEEGVGRSADDARGGDLGDQRGDQGLERRRRVPEQSYCKVLKMFSKPCEHPRDSFNE